MQPENDPCVASTTSRMYAINPATGGGLDYGIFNNRPVVNSKVVSGIVTEGKTGGISLKMDPKPTICTSEVCIPMNLGELGRQSWRRVQ